MPKRMRVWAWMTLLAAMPAAASPDPVQIDLLGRYPLLLRWDNVRDEPLWVTGAKPFPASGGSEETAWPESHRYYRVRLSSGESTTVWVPASEGLRVDRPQGRLNPQDLQFMVSNGSGLYVGAAVQPSAQGDSLLLPPDWPEERLVRISRPAVARDALEAALFVSRRDALSEPAPYRDRVDFSMQPFAGEQSLPVTQAGLRPGSQAAAQPYWLLPAGLPARLHVRGPIRLALEHRLRYPLTETQTRQTYRIYARLNGRPWQALDFAAGAETRQAVWVDGCAETLGRLETGYLELPTGEHELALESTLPLYARVLAQDDSDYLLPSLNAPPLTAAEARAARPVEHGSIWDMTPKQLAHPLERMTLAGEERTALRLGRDNQYRDGGLIASIAMQQAALAHREDPRLAGQAQDLFGLFTFYRPLLPVNKPSSTPQQFVWLQGRRLLAQADRLREAVIAERFSVDALNTLSPAYLLELPPQAELEYRLPERQTPSRLRLAFNPSGLDQPVDLWLRYDDQPPVPVRVQPPELAGSLFLPSPGEAALALLGKRHGVPVPTTLTAPFGAWQTPGALVPAAMMELPLPAGVRRIRLGGAGQPLQVALHYRASRPYQLSESAYLDMVRRLGPGAVYHEFQQRLRKAADSPVQAGPASPETGFAEDRDARRELANHWQPLLRLLSTQTRHFMAGLAPAPAPQSPVSEKALTGARRLTQSEQWLPALEQWSTLSEAANPLIREEAVTGQTQALEQLNEEFLAELMLRGIFAYDPDDRVQERAFTRLMQRYTAAEDAESLLTLTGVAAVRRPDPTRLRQLAGLLLEQDQPDLALMTALALPPAEWPVEIVLRAAGRLRWQRVFDHALERLPDAAQRALWRGYRAEKQGHYPEALREWREAGPTGHALAAALEEGLALRGQLSAADVAARERAVTGWVVWSMHHPGPWLWRNAEYLVSDHAGAAALHAVERDLFAQTFRAQPEHPVRLTVYGPARLRLTARLLHPADEPEQPLDDWLLVRDGGRIERLPITGDRPSQGLTLVGDVTAQPGRLISLDYTAGPGLHVVEIAAHQHALLVAPLVWRPEQPLSVLPEPTPAAVAAAALGWTPGESKQNVRDTWTWPPSGWAGIRRDPAAWDAALQEAGLPVQVVAGCQLQPLPLPPQPLFQLDTDTLRATLNHVAASNPAGLAWPGPPPGPAQILRSRLIETLWDVEQHPEQLAQRLPGMEQAVAAQPGTPGVEPLLRRLRRRADWEPFLAVTRSAGLRYLETSGWQPETPLLRVRKALTPLAAADEQVLSGVEQLGLLTANPAPARLQIDLQVMDLRYLPPQPLIVWHQLDGQQEQPVLLTPDAARQPLTVTIPPGEHVLRIGLADPAANQFLRVRVREQRGGAFQPVTSGLKRLYQIATLAEPWQSRLEGPAWLRIDEWRSGALSSRYRYFGPGLHDLELRPAIGQSEALFRVHRQRVLDAPRETTPPRITRWTLEPVPDAPAQVPEAPPPSTWVMADRYALGEQQAGTWGLGATLARSIPPPNEGSGGLADEYLEINGHYRYYDDDWHNFYEMEALYRLHQRGDPTFGLRGLWQHESDWPGVSYQLSWEGYAQQSGAWAWNSTVRGQIRQRRDLTPKLHHTPSLGFFTRYLDQQSGFDGRPGYVDQDVFSTYKDFHRHGLVLADTLVYQPWLDALWHGSVALTSDEDGNLLDPEQFNAGIGWKQQLGSWQAGIGYDWTYYFAQGNHDWDRPEATQNRTVLGHLLWDKSGGGQGRLNLELRMQYDLDSRSYGAWLSAQWFPDRGRGYRDFRSVDFRGLRERQLPLEFNNRQDAPPGEDYPQ